MVKILGTNNIFSPKKMAWKRRKVEEKFYFLIHSLIPITFTNFFNFFFNIHICIHIYIQIRYFVTLILQSF